MKLPGNSKQNNSEHRNTATKKDMESWVASWDHRHRNADEIQSVNRLDFLCCQFCIKDLTNRGAIKKKKKIQKANKVV